MHKRCTACRLEPTKAQWPVELGFMQMSQGKLREARETLERVLAGSPEHPEALLGLKMLSEKGVRIKPELLQPGFRRRMQRT